MLRRRRTLVGDNPAQVGPLALVPGLEAWLPGAGELVAGFWSIDGEPDTVKLLRAMAGRGLTVLLPAPGASRQAVQWGVVTAASCALPAARPGSLPEPPPPHLPASELRRCQLVLVPALAVDRSGTRLGRGGGWYDRALQHAAPSALVLAVVYPSEVLPAGTLPRENHDQMVDGALTWSGVELFDMARPTGGPAAPNAVR